MNVASVTSRFSHAGDRLTIAVDPPSRAGERRQFTVKYQAFLPEGLRIGINQYGERTFFSQNWPDNVRQWLPVIDHPYDKAISEFIVTAPARYQVVARGLLQEQIWAMAGGDSLETIQAHRVLVGSSCLKHPCARRWSSTGIHRES